MDIDTLHSCEEFKHLDNFHKFETNFRMSQNDNNVAVTTVTNTITFRRYYLDCDTCVKLYRVQLAPPPNTDSIYLLNSCPACNEMGVFDLCLRRIFKDNTTTEFTELPNDPCDPDIHEIYLQQQSEFYAYSEKYGRCHPVYFGAPDDDD